MTNEHEASNSERLLELLERSLKTGGLCLVLFALFLAFMHHSVWKYGIDEKDLFGSFFDLDGESTICSWFASIQWFAVSLAALTAYFIEKSFRTGRWWQWWWLATALVFLVASVDETAILHENIGLWLLPHLKGRGLGTSVWGFFDASPWLVFYTVPLFTYMAITLIFLGDRLKQSRETLAIACVGISSYVTAMVIEFVQGMPDPKLKPIADFCGVTCHIFYTRTVLIEETLENLGTTAMFMAIAFYCIKTIREAKNAEHLVSDREEA